MANPLLVIESVSEDSEDSKDSEGKTDKKKMAAAEDLLAAVKENDPDAVVESITALYRLCALEE